MKPSSHRFPARPSLARPSLSAAARTILLSLAAFALLTVAAFAHGGLLHVMGSVVKTDTHTITVALVHGGTDTVTVTPKTSIAMLGKSNGTPKLSDIRPGDAIVIHAKHQGQSLVAVEVQFTHRGH